MSLREALEEAVNTVEAQVETPVTPEKVEPVAKSEPVEKSETVEAKPSRTEGRPRDEHGRLLPGKAEKSEKIDVKPAVEAKPEVVAETIQRLQRPSSWKKEHWDDWDKLDPKVAKYIHEREGQFASGVSTYKQDYERVKPLVDAVAPYEPFMRQMNITPHEFVDRLAKTDQSLRYGTPQQKLQTFARLATDYQIPIHEMLVQGEDGKVYFNQQYFQTQTQQPQQGGGLTKEEVQKMLQEQASNTQWMTAIQNFVAAKDDKGNPKHPHFDTVKQTMDGLLRSKLAPDLETAYSKALRMHDDIWEAEQKSKQDAAQKAHQEAQAKQVAKAKAAAVSTRTTTPGAESAKATKGIRSALEAAVDAHSEGGRV